MPSPSWHVHIQGETIGPLPTETIAVMLRQNRLQFLDFVWSEHLTKWQRIADLDEFASLVPPYPSAPIPSRGKSAPAAASVEAPPRERESEPAPPPAPPKAEAPSKPAASVDRTPPARAQQKEKSWPKIRRYVRIPIEAGRATLVEHGVFEVMNVSEGGIFVKSKQPPPLGTEVKFSLELKGVEKKLEMTGVIIRHGIVDEIEGAGIEFTRLNPAHRRLLQDYVNSRDTSG